MPSETTTPNSQPVPAVALGSQSDASLSPRAILGHIIASLAILAATVYMLHAGWERWNDPIVDFGRELYLPWQITQGKVLYRDLASFNGPLSPYLNALWFRLFGVGLHTLIYCNIAITFGVIAMLYRLALLTAGIWAAFAACLVFVFVSAFSQFGSYGNENYLAPYSHEATHGIALSLAALLLFHRFLQKPGAARLAAVGFFVGLVFLTKVEILVAAASAIAGAWAVHSWRARTPIKVAIRQAGTLVAAGVVPPLIAFLLLAAAMPARDALLGTFGSLRHSFNSRLTTNVYFQEVTGLGDPLHHLARAALMLAAISLVLGLVSLAAWRARGGVGVRVLIGAAVFLAALLPLYFNYEAVPWNELSRSLTLWVVLIGAAWAVPLFRAGRGQTDNRVTLALAWAFFAGAMLLKMILNVRLNHYGFALAMPALTLFVAAVFGWWPDACARAGGSAAVMRMGAAGAFVLFLVAHVSLSNSNHRAFNFPIGEGSDRFLFHRADNRTQDFSNLLGALGAITRPDQTLAVMPEGVMANYLLRRTNPTPYTFYEPSDVMMFGEEHIIASLDAHPPDFVAFIHKDTSQFGVRFFGTDYASDLHAWVLAHYHEAAAIGPPPFSGDNGGILLLARNQGDIGSKPPP